MRYALLASIAATAFNNDTCEGVIITTEAGPVLINKSDYDPDKHSIDQDATDTFNNQSSPRTVNTAPTYAEGVTPPPSPSAGVANAVAPTTPSPGQMAVMQKGKKWIAVYVQSGEPVVDTRIEPKGYDSEALAWEALMPVIHNPTPLGSPGPGSENVIPGSPAAEATTTV